MDEPFRITSTTFITKIRKFSFCFKGIDYPCDSIDFYNMDNRNILLNITEERKPYEFR